jgi:hypothetical protein
MARGKALPLLIALQALLAVVYECSATTHWGHME